jgi:hypothetical protein
VLAVALIYRFYLRQELAPRHYLFLGAVSGLVFGASEVVHYFTVNGLAEFYLTVQPALPEIQRLLLAGHSAPDSVFAVLIGPVRYFVLDFVWRFVTDPITHACWAGLTGYFIGLAASGRHRWYTVSWIGLAAAAILHGLNAGAWSTATCCGFWSRWSAPSCSWATRRWGPVRTRRCPGPEQPPGLGPAPARGGNTEWWEPRLARSPDRVELGG